MPNRTASFLGGLELEEHLDKMSDRDLMEFTARQVFAICRRCETEDKRITTLENRDKRVFGITGGIGGIIGAIFIAMVDYFVRRQ